MLAGIVAEAARRFGSRPAFVSGGSRRWALPFAELDRISDEVAAGLAGRGVGEGDIVALAFPVCVDYAVAYAAAEIGIAGEPDEIGGCLRVAGGLLPRVGEDIDRPVAIVFTSGTTGVPKGAVFTGRHLALITRCDVVEAWGPVGGR